jgi:hypothetical protein
VTDGRHLNAPAFAIQTWSGAFFCNDQDPERRRSNISSRNAADKLKPVIFGFGLPGYENGIHLMLW